ncbi:NAD(P)H-dependent glycerol-3-phosphate dehydrogenase [Paraliomyxa miuraensis]|uniref:NAD(P)H-dependent glycerol-3-phosphate dehydrogenase n=1 Tax=Paraliomyxa miuraensis TaxID=376150 RepID=UPI00224F5F8E|nr:NAD(P)-binding domain-containing protein [Paraliomyxa miuraensis]MCX4242940.1 NAD(P)-binding domain-containing protein [Paraliomyxa miuraensis]
MSPPVAVVGGGSFGRSLAQAAARVGQRVLLWSRQPRPMPAVAGDGSIHTVSALPELAEAELLLFAVPSPYVAELADELGRSLDGSHLLVHVSRGLLGDDLHTVSEVLSSRTPCRRVGALAGPLVARNLVEGQPGGAIIGSAFPEVVESVSDAIGGPTLRVYGTDDLMGVEIASALVGLVALALGYAQRLGMGPGTLAVLATRGLAEATRVGEMRGGSARTFAGLAGAGDLIAAVAGDGRPEVEFGRALAEGLGLRAAAERAGAYIEGALLAKQVAAFGRRVGVEVPLSGGLARLMAGELSAEQLAEALMARPAKRE